jgi:hypothetical protein
MEVSRVVVLDNRSLEEIIVNELIGNQTLLLKEKYTWMARAIYKSSHLDPKAAYGLSSARTHGRLQL